MADGPQTTSSDSADPGAPATTGRPTDDTAGVLTLVCVNCGTEYYFEDEYPPDGISCEKCGNKVFREFFTAESSEAAEDFEDSTHRDLDPDDAEGETMPGDVLDLNRD